MDFRDIKIGYCFTGSFCTFSRALEALSELSKTGADIYPIMSMTSYTQDTRFGSAENFKNQISAICGREIIHTVKESEPIGPKALLDLLIISPCTGNTLAKLAAGIADTSPTMAAKAHLRNMRPVLVGISTNDGLANAAKNIGTLLNSRNYYFIPFGQDDYKNKPSSLVCDMTKTLQAAEAALSGKQLQPILLK